VAAPHDRAKEAAARYAVERFVKPPQRLALGTGTTAQFAIRAIAQRFAGAALECVASSRATEELAESLGLPVRGLRPDDRFDLMLDGADEVSPQLALTKGGGGALLREKLLARLARRRVILVDPSKLVSTLGEHLPIPVEIVPFARPVLEHQLAEAGFEVRARHGRSDRPFLTDNGNEILDLAPRRPVDDPAALDRRLHRYVGVIETGIFVGLAERVIVGHDDGSVEVRSRTGRRAG
jgi:ribose 5-phosphate isomerase A